MIIQRFTAAMRRQDWFQVAVEVVIVVIGIFIGLQVDDWNTARLERAEGQDYLDRLYQDLEYDIRHFETLRTAVINKQQSLIDIGDLIETGDRVRTYSHLLEDGSETTVDFYVALENSVQFGWSFPAVRTTTFRDMQNSGTLSLIENEDLRYAISFYYEEAIIFRDRIRARISGYAPSVYGMLSQGERTMFAGDTETMGRDLILPTLDSELAIGDFIEQAKTPAFNRLLKSEINYAGFLAIMIDVQLRLTRQLMADIDAARGAS